MLTLTIVSIFSKYVSIKPERRKLLNGANSVGLLVDILLKEGFHLSTRTVSAEEKTECYCFERMR